jgi:uncharacterized membrane protein
MNLVHLHLLLNHFPTVGMIIGLAVFVMAMVTRSDDLKRASLWIFVGIALLSIPIFVTGTSAELALRHTPAVSQSTIDTHETAAFEALWFMELTGALAWLGLWQYRRLSRLPQGTLSAVLVVGLASFGLMARAATIGGEIRHPEISLGPATVGAVTPDPPLARAIGSYMVNHKWGFAASQTVHFVGLCLLFGVVLLIDLRMLGFIKSIPFSALHRLLPWALLGFGVNVATGVLFVISNPPDFYVTAAIFVWKVVFVLVAAANALYFTVFEQAWTLGPGDTAPMAAKVAAASSIFLWVGVIFCGQMLPFIGHSY